MVNGESDAQLLGGFHHGGEQAAFAALVQRHGPAVLAACRRVLRNEHDAEDVFQATFLLLARKAPELTGRESVRGWLCAAAHRLSLNARAGASRRSRRETPVAALAGCGAGGGDDPLAEAPHPDDDPLAEVARRELRLLVDDELRLLPEKYRAPVVLCDLEGMTHAEAARRLGWPAGSMSRRLDRARALLRQRLAGRGLPLAMVLLCAAVVALRDWRRDPADHPGPGTARATPTPFKPHTDNVFALERLLNRLGRDGLTPSDATALARRSDAEADRLVAAVPDRNQDQWKTYAEETRQAAAQMSRAARDADGNALQTSARRLNGSCVRCHLAFRQDAGPQTAEPGSALFGPTLR
jgi:RNA polymerase sigma-70 factor (ECF subfamily)